MKKNNSIKNDLIKKLIFAIITSILFIIGIPITIFSATNHIWFAMTLGIIFIVFGFYGMPFIWLSYANLRSLKNVVDAVNEEHILSVSEIASQLQLKENQVRQFIVDAIKKKYIIGYIFDGNTLSTNNKNKPSIQERKCSHCGGNLVKKDNDWYCPYCDSKFE